MDKVKDDIKEKGLSADDVYDRATSTPDKSGNKMKRKETKNVLFVSPNLGSTSLLIWEVFVCADF